MFFDLLIRGAKLIDGTGAPARRADVAIARERILAVGDLAAEAASAARVIDAAGLVAAPGFIDVHTHSDGWLCKIPNLVAKTSQGFTTEVLMSDGISYAPVSESNWRQWFVYLRALNGLELSDYSGWRTIADYMAVLDGRTAQNVAAQIPYANLRVLAAGWGRAPLDDTQTNLMRRAVEQAMDAGAVGISTGLDYVSQCFATIDELVEVCSAMHSWGGIYATHVRYKKGTLGGVREAVEIGRRADVPVHISHLKAGSTAEADEILSYIDRVAVNEVDFSFDVYPYLAGSTMLHYILPYEAWEDGPLGVPAKLVRQDIRAKFATLLEIFPAPLERIVLAWGASKASAAYVGQTAAEYVARSGKRAADALADLLIAENLAVLCVIRSEDDALIDPFVAHPRFMLGSDGIFFADGQIHPRMYGSAARVLGTMVRERRLFSIEEAVRKLSAIPAGRFGLVDRGEIRPGAFADVVLFDPSTISDHATYDSPHQLSTGVERVLVNGVEVFAGGKASEIGPELPGRALRFKESFTVAD
jgi:N-acyl-D-amino-acid deacylase